MNHFTFKDPIWFLAVFALFVVWLLRRNRRIPVLLVPFAAAWHRPSLAGFSRWPVIIGFTGLLLMIAALARPQFVEDKRQVRSQGYDIMLAIDLSPYVHVTSWLDRIKERPSFKKVFE